LLRPDELVEHRHVRLARDVNRRSRLGPMKPEPIARITEDCPDVGRYLFEAVPRPRPVGAAVLEAASIRVDQSTQQLLRPPINECRLPIGELDRSLVLSAGAVLRKETRPAFQ
jgi:hypothetical protein